jgi:hypothetical protein
MSYMTQYTLEHDVPEEEWPELKADLTDYVQDLVDGSTVPASWYRHEEEMLHTSKTFPGHNFILTGVGEGDEELDMWKKLFRDGAVYETRAEIVWPDFAPGLPVDLLTR